MEGSSSRERNSNKNDDNDKSARLGAAEAICDISRAPPVENWDFLYGIIGKKRSDSIERILVAGDVDSRFKWLCLNAKRVKDHLLPMLIEAESLKEPGIEVDTYDTKGNEYKMTFKIKRPGSYVLDGHGWTNFVEAHKLEESDHINIWMFRNVHSNKLCCLILKNEQIERFKKARLDDN